MLEKKYRLKKSSAFTATYKTNNAYRKNGLTVFLGREKNSDIITKIGFVVSKKIHKRAVKRNRIKRLMRESMRLYIKSCDGNFSTKYMSLIFVASKGLLDKNFEYVDNAVKVILKAMKI